MLQHPVSLSASAKYLPHDNVQFNSAVRFQKDPYTARPAYQSRAPGPVVPLSISTNLVPSPSTTSAKHPRSPYISSRQLSGPVPVPVAQNAPAFPSALSQCASFGANSTLEDVLAPGDMVGEGLPLQGEMVRLVSSTPHADDSPPAKEFEVVRRLGTGSYAVVYLVHEVLSRPAPSEDGHMSMIGSMELDGNAAQAQIVYGREFAIKLLSKANLDEEALEAQMSEVTIHQSLRLHPNIVTLYRTLETSSFLLLLLEYVPGEDLFYFLEQARDHYDLDSTLNPSDTLSASHTPPTPSLLSNLHPSQLLSRTRLRLIASMFSQMCDAVTACHAQNVFHRDIKPENFIVTDGLVTSPEGRQERKVVVKLTDFGLSTTDLESSDMDCGSAPYMSFECRNNVAPTYSPRAADVWSLGIVLINMLYHYNPWTDTSEGVCNSFDLYLRDPVNFFVGRFPGMTRVVAEFLATNVFCILDDTKGNDGQRISAASFGAWIKNLPMLLGGHGMQRTVSTSSTHGHPITSVPISHRPTSRHPSVAAVMRTPAMVTLSLSRAPEERSELSIVYDHENEEERDDPEMDDLAQEGTASRSTSTAKRRKRGARKGKGNGATSPTSAQDETLATLAQSLARELSKQSTGSKSSSTSRRQPSFEPTPVFALPTPLIVSQPTKRSNSSTSPSAPSPSTPMPVPTKKPSRWKLSFGKANASTLTANLGRVTPTEEVAPSLHADQPVSSTVSGVTSLIMGLNAPPLPTSSSIIQPSNNSDDASSTWSRGRGNRTSSPGHNSSRSPGRSLTSKSQTNLDRLPDRRSERAISPNSTRSGRPVASSNSSMVSGNWRSSMSTTSSAGTSTSAFTRYSNSSMRSISTTATSVSAASWRASVKQPSVASSKYSNSYSGTGGYTTIPKNIKIITGTPWELDQVPRQQYSNPSGDIFGSPPPRKQRSKKQPKDLKLDTINERPPAAKLPESLRKDAMTSTTDLPDLDGSKEDGEGGVKKVHKGQINALAKMLSALRR